jgi:hypothetical protein
VGVDRQSGADSDVVIEATSAANAKVKGELQGIIVTQIRPAGEPRGRRIAKRLGLTPMPLGHKGVLISLGLCWLLAPDLLIAGACITDAVAPFQDMSAQWHAVLGTIIAPVFGGILLAPLAMYRAVQRSPECEHLRRTEQPQGAENGPAKRTPFEIVFALLVIAATIAAVAYALWQDAAS